MDRGAGFHYLDSRELWSGAGDFGLETPRELLRLLGDPQDKVPSIHVAGTNGKGSVCAMLAAMLRAAGKSVGQFTSPHLVDVTERCTINGKPCEAGLFDARLFEVAEAAKAGGLEPSYFEVVCAAAFLEFARRKLDWMVIEVGLGGRLDATNIMRAPKASVITGIDYDHTHILGDTLELIAAEKAGIIKTDVPVFLGEANDSVRDVFLARAEEVGTIVRCQAQDFTYSNGVLEDRHRGVTRVGLQQLALAGVHQHNNAILAARVAWELDLSVDAIERGLQTVRWPGRLEEIESSANGSTRQILCDVAHNIGGIRRLCDYLETRNVSGDIVFVLSILDRKDWSGMLAVLREFQTSRGNVKFIFTDCGHARAVGPELLAQRIEGAQSISDPHCALDFALEHSSASDILVLTGSIFLVGLLRGVFVQEVFQTIAQ